MAQPEHAKAATAGPEDARAAMARLEHAKAPAAKRLTEEIGSRCKTGACRVGNQVAVGGGGRRWHLMPKAARCGHHDMAMRAARVLYRDGRFAGVRLSLADGHHAIVGPAVVAFGSEGEVVPSCGPLSSFSAQSEVVWLHTYRAVRQQPCTHGAYPMPSRPPLPLPLHSCCASALDSPASLHIPAPFPPTPPLPHLTSSTRCKVTCEGMGRGYVALPTALARPRRKLRAGEKGRWGCAGA
eukprot:350298-Chlamydomonas_euryale.AAC.1